MYTKFSYENLTVRCYCGDIDVDLRMASYWKDRKIIGCGSVDWIHMAHIWASFGFLWSLEASKFLKLSNFSTISF
jgi:hypothetical protein